MSKPIYLGITVWGREYCETFADYCLGSLLAKGNIPALDNSTGNNTFLIATTKADWQWFQTHPNFKLLKQYMKAEFIELYIVSEETYQQMNHNLNSCKLYNVSLGQTKIVSRMYRDKAVGGVIYGDTIYAQNALTSAYRFILTGKKIVMFHFCRFARTQQLLSGLMELGYIKPGKPIEISNRDLVRVALQCLHIDIAMQNWNAPVLPEFAIEMAWSLPNQKGILFHPLSFWYVFIDYSRLVNHNIECLQNDTIDSTYLRDNFTKDDAHLITDSDIFTAISFSPDLPRKPVLITDIHTTPINYATIGPYSMVGRFTNCSGVNPDFLLNSAASFEGKLSDKDVAIKLAYLKERIYLQLNTTGQIDLFKIGFTQYPIYMHSEDLDEECFTIEQNAQHVIGEIISFLEQKPTESYEYLFKKVSFLRRLLGFSIEVYLILRKKLLRGSEEKRKFYPVFCHNIENETESDSDKDYPV
ncbi:MAG: hypothetical protein Q8R24_08865 [Legionellaceae bacterium]|nr:hypothetical protein [Legionellaceae bacterium]